MPSVYKHVAHPVLLFHLLFSFDLAWIWTNTDSLVLYGVLPLYPGFEEMRRFTSILLLVSSSLVSLSIYTSPCLKTQTLPTFSLMSLISNLISPFKTYVTGLCIFLVVSLSLFSVSLYEKRVDAGRHV